MTGSTTVDSKSAKGRASKNTVDQAQSVAKSRRRRHRFIVTAVVLLSTAVVGGLAAWGIHEATKKPPYLSPLHTSRTDDGVIAAGTGKIRVDMYVDFQCSACRSLDASAAPALDKLLATNAITLVYHPVSLLDAKTKTQYSTRAASSAACAADYGYFLPYVRLLLANQPLDSSGTGLTDDQIVQIGGQTGMINPHFAQCVRADKYHSWVTHVTAQAAAKKVTTAPTVLVNGRSIGPRAAAPTLAELQAAIAAAER